MGTIILHTGRPKAGSSSVQNWLASRSMSLGEEHGIRLLVTRDRTENGAKRVHVVPHESGGVNSGLFVRRYFGLGEGAELAGRFCDELNEQAQRHEMVVMSSEAFALLFERASVPFLERLNQLGATHDVRVAHYVRPQHTSLEAWWRQWGFRSGQTPSCYLREIATGHDYWQSWRAVRDVAPLLGFEMRPFLRDQLVDGDVVVDFATTFLGIPRVVAYRPEERSNVGLPLGLVNLLQAVPPGALWKDQHDNRELDRLRSILSEHALSDSPETERSRDLLQHWCHEVFEAGNQHLIRSRGWSLDWFVPPVPDRPPGRAVVLEELDELWSSEVAAHDLATVAALDRARASLADS